VFDVRPDRLDLRDYPYRPPLRSLPARYPADEAMRRWLPAYVKAGLVLDQGSEGACIGFGLACVVNYLLFVRHLESGNRAQFQSVSPRMLYELAKRYDEWPGETYEGSSCRGALKGWQKHGVCGESFWPYPFDAKRNALFVPPKSGWEKDASSRTLGVYCRIDRQSVAFPTSSARGRLLGRGVWGGWSFGRLDPARASLVVPTDLLLCTTTPLERSGPG